MVAAVSVMAMGGSGAPLFVIPLDDDDAAAAMLSRLLFKSTIAASIAVAASLAPPVSTLLVLSDGLTIEDVSLGLLSSSGGGEFGLTDSTTSSASVRRRQAEAV